jgi:hypothetical protein
VMTARGRVVWGIAVAVTMEVDMDNFNLR